MPLILVTPPEISPVSLEEAKEHMHVDYDDEDTHITGSMERLTMPWAAPKHCPHGHPPFTDRRCPQCSANSKAMADQRRGAAHERGYNSRWNKARKHYLIAHPLCAEHERQGHVVPATVVDHIKPHKGDQALFWDRTNWQPLCKTCHDRKTAIEDGGFGRPTCTPGGRSEL